MKTLLFLAITIGSFNAFAAGKCENMAKNGAIHSYVSDVEGVDSSNMTLTASLESTVKGLEKYSVTIESPCVVEGDDSNCSAAYSVVTKDLGTKCVVKSVKQIKE